MVWSEVALKGDGCLEWEFHESLMGLKPAKRLGVSDGDKTFTSAAPPAKQFGLKGVDEDETADDDASDD